MLYCFHVFNPIPFAATTPMPNVTIILLRVFRVVQIFTTFFTPCLYSLLFPFAITCPPRASSGIFFSKGLSLITCLGFCLKSDLDFLIFGLFPPLVPISLHCLHMGVFSFFGWVPHPFRRPSGILSSHTGSGPQSLLSSNPNETCFSVYPPWFLIGLRNYSSIWFLKMKSIHSLPLFQFTFSLQSAGVFITIIELLTSRGCSCFFVKICWVVL